jgi:hypothetical protein
MSTEAHRLSPTARATAVYLDDALSGMVRDAAARERLADNLARGLDEAGLLHRERPRRFGWLPGRRAARVEVHSGL